MACDVLSKVAKMHGMFYQGWKKCMDVLSRMAKWHVMFCPGWQSGM